MVDAIPVPDSRQKVDELFLFWLSEPSTQEMLRNELTKVCRYGGSGDLSGEGSGGGDSPNILDSLVQQSAALTSVPRSSSPGYRTPSPPLHLSNSPKSPRTKRRARSPRRNLKQGLSAAGEKSGPAAVVGFDDVDYFPAALVEPAATGVERDEKPNAQGRKDADSSTREAAQKTKRAPPQSEKGAKRTRVLNEVIPRFFFPNGRAGDAKEGVEKQLKEAGKVLQEQLNGEVSLEDFHLVVKVICTNSKSCALPSPT